MASLKNLFEGRPFRTPLHAVSVHLPLALLPLSVLVDLASWIWSDRDVPFLPIAFYCLCGGIFTALVAAVFGFVDYTEIRRDAPAHRTAVLHMVLNLFAVIVFAASAVLHFRDLNGMRITGFPLFLSITGLLILAYSGYLGGHLVYSEGIGVGRHRRNTPLPKDTLCIRSAHAELVAVADAEMLAERSTLRVNVAGTVVAIARLNGKVYAFQEFCTHRFGPLSEGSFDKCEVVCPWHNSRFDLRTGKVIGGPAKVDLPVFRVEERDGKIWVQAPRGNGS